MSKVQAEWISLGTMKYDEALAVQERQRDDVLNGATDRQVVFTVEHPPTITIGRNGTSSHIVAPRAYLESLGMEVYEVDRGGDVTYHGPGQLVVYPIFHLQPWDNDVGRYVRMLEESVIVALRDVGLIASRLEGYPGVWMGTNKICAVGVRMRRRPSGELVTSHGIALNVNTDLSHFQTIIPCGLADKGVTSIERETGRKASMVDWERRLMEAFSAVFQAEFSKGALRASGQ
ncbi:lipoyl(octanoyl) transferase LipB [Alicyclobacillus pomorum]|uniref:lipoyl(octanoyl) transferase LipB n=1 Tax=Alicyclobacillus pomorum TaxID=204470 RepID=UPI00040C46F3|nr:lipoyl(octanoyl) transferase LipB [Alicyclobacillus pomorum]